MIMYNYAYTYTYVHLAASARVRYCRSRIIYVSRSRNLGPVWYPLSSLGPSPGLKASLAQPLFHPVPFSSSSPFFSLDPRHPLSSRDTITFCKRLRGLLNQTVPTSFYRTARPSVVPAENLEMFRARSSSTSLGRCINLMLSYNHVNFPRERH